MFPNFVVDSLVDYFWL